MNFKPQISAISIICIFSISLFSQSLKVIKSILDPVISASTIEDLTFIDPGVFPFSGYRWRDVAGNFYSDTYRDNYGYDDIDVQVQVTFEESDVSFNGQLSATHLKPNFAYQFKINGFSGTASNERIGLAGRWWQETWNGSQWSNGQNLNNKGDGSYPNPNDVLYFQRRDIEDLSSTTGKKYRFTGYLVCDYFITDENGDAVLDFEANSSYHVLWNTIQESHTSNDGPTKSAIIDPDPTQYAYDTEYPTKTMTIFGEWERLPIGNVYLAPGAYDCQIILTEESFHGWLGGLYNGQWAAAMGANIQFVIEEDGTVYVQLSFFSAESDNSCVYIRWVTESEVDHAGFDILRSTSQEDGYSSISNYQNNSELMGKGNSSTRKEYLYIDNDVLPGQSYWYRLVSVDLNGQRTYHGPVQVNLVNNKGLNYLSSNIPDQLMLYPNFPNPFNPITIIRFDIIQTSQVQNTISLTIYNSRGQQVRVLYQGNVSAGSYEIKWDGRSDTGIDVCSGVYYAVLINNYTSIVKTMTLLR